MIGRLAEVDPVLGELEEELGSLNSPKTVKPCTLALIFKQDRSKVLLGYKKRGFGVGLYNGFGGKIQHEESALEGAKRELEEESGLTSEDLVKIGILYFEFESDPVILTAHLYTSDRFNGVPVETEEMRPEWFDINNIPFTKMWNDDKYWFSFAVENKPFIARFSFKSDLKTIVRHNINFVDPQLLNEVPIWYPKS
ncbi:7,8-dihydro-8-oxoguanine triphosphatase [Smittium mucronatum]|uniref:Oxidized purine nucleoside triphosphate hydrolase n=1 Tax=Smittium mucronatum TaxID=133383 RepID=A0A1R0GSQ2_9FUNG|nr:7,8-dihydro-8-oxoguanine triphosphatase [Smittium mucronatum]